MKKILITGCSGYIGSHLIKYLENNYEIHGLDINEPIVSLSKFYKKDINALTQSLDEQYDAVIHLAALVKVSESELTPVQYYSTNINGTINVMNNITTRNFIFSSTGAAAICNSAYGTSKRAAEDCVREISNKHVIDYTIFRFYNVIGSEYGISPTNPDSLMYKLKEAITSGQFTIFGKDYETKDGTCVRDYVHVIEICEAIRLAIESPSNSIECLGHGVGYTVNEIVTAFKQVNNVEFEVRYGQRRKGDIPISVLEDVSPYMKQMYNFDQLIKI